MRTLSRYLTLSYGKGLYESNWTTSSESLNVVVNLVIQWFFWKLFISFPFINEQITRLYNVFWCYGNKNVVDMKKILCKLSKSTNRLRAYYMKILCINLYKDILLKFYDRFCKDHTHLNECPFWFQFWNLTVKVKNKQKFTQKKKRLKLNWAHISFDFIIWNIN